MAEEIFFEHGREDPVYSGGLNKGRRIRMIGTRLTVVTFVASVAISPLARQALAQGGP